MPAAFTRTYPLAVALLASVALAHPALAAVTVATTAPAAPTTQPLTADDIHKLIDAGQYRDALRALARIVQLTGIAAAPYDRHDTLTMKAECLLQIHDVNNALATLALDQKESNANGKPYAALLSAAFAELIKKSPAAVYTPHTPAGKPKVKILDRSARQEAYDDLFADDFDIFQRKSAVAITSKSLPQYVEAARVAAAMRTAEYASTKSTKQSDEAVKSLADGSLKLLNDLLDGMANQNKLIADAASRLITSTYMTSKGAGQYTHERGLLPSDTTTLKTIIDDCSKVPQVAGELAKAFDMQPEDFKAAAIKAADIKDTAHTILTADYSGVGTQTGN